MGPHAPELLFVSSVRARQTEFGACLRGTGWKVDPAPTIEDALVAAQARAYDVILADYDLNPRGCWKDLLSGTRCLQGQPPVLLACSATDTGLWADAINAGAFDLILRPFDRMEVLCALKFASPGAPPGKKAPQGTILAIETPALQTLLRVALCNEGYRVFTPDPASALRLLQAVDITLVITGDPAQVAAVRPDARILYISAVPDAAILRELPNPSVGVLQKPFRLEQLRAEVMRLCRRKPAQSESRRTRPRAAGAIQAGDPPPPE